ncbi:type II secretion system minor pseudopilin GspK [Teredinibacter waterburyi]|uniref:type II secretion system minor pseudopilin GspK n=1 Tax=Teredinibacter waterburyi TaxID=1500538 RepID=UPI001FE598C7|nr:type II secretion system minor pseudopilin GspK [Teredinibacter waterburyi]
MTTQKKPLQMNSTGFKRGPQQSQRGVALVLALLIVALVTTIAVELSWRFDLSIVRAGNRWFGMQGDIYLRGAEDFAKWGLQQDKLQEQASGKAIDTLYDVWATPLEAPIDESWIRGRMEDAQGRFNLNLLAKSAQPIKGRAPEPWERFTASQRRFIRLLQTINLSDSTLEGEGVYLDEQSAINITEAVIDWIDVDSNVTGFGGAESDYYSGLEPPYLVANKKFMSVSELYLIRGMNYKLYQGLLPFVIALPEQALTNVNTMSLEMLRTINDKRSLMPNSIEDAQYIFSERGGGFDTVGDFQGASSVDQVVGVAANGQSNFDATDLVVATEYFLLFTEVQVDDYIRRSKSLLRRVNDEVTTLRRTDANF